MVLVQATGGHVANCRPTDSSNPCHETKDFSVLNVGSITWYNWEELVALQFAKLPPLLH